MHEDLHRYLDGDLPLEALPPQLRAEAKAWDEILAEFAVLREDRAPAWLEARVMAELPAAPRPAIWYRIVRWLLEPKQIRVRPVVGLMGAMTALVILVLPALQRSGRVEPDFARLAPVPASVDAAAPVVYVQFVFTGEARSVALAGDFNGWDPERHLLRDPDGDGVWTGLFPIPPGMHKYMFVVDGERWVTDPRAERYIDDGFGMRNALVSVIAPTGRTS